MARLKVPAGNDRRQRTDRRGAVGFEWLEDRALLSAGATSAPYATSLAATDVTSTTATLQGSVNPNGGTADALFEYSVDPNLVAAVTTLAGTGEGGSDDGPGALASFGEPLGVAVDGAGNVYVADTGSDCIRKITPDGAVSTLAGSPGGYGSADGAGSAAQFSNPTGLAVDDTGNVYVADRDNDLIRKITPDGVVTTLAGTAFVAGNTDGTGAAALFDQPAGIAVDGAGNLYVADSTNHTIRTITPAGVVTTLAGSGRDGDSDGTGAAASFSSPNGIAVDGAGNVYVADGGNQAIRKVTPAGVVTTVVEAEDFGSPLPYPSSVAVDDAGNLYVANSEGETIVEITAAGVLTTLAGVDGQAGNTDGPGSDARFSGPTGIAVNAAGVIDVADAYNKTIRQISPPTKLVVQAGMTGSNDVPESTALAGLQPGATYYFRAVAAGPDATTDGGTLSFTTSSVAPTAEATAAPAVGFTTATLKGRINPNGSDTTVAFAYGTDPALMTGVITTAPLAIGDGTHAIAVSVPVTGLLAQSTYFFRVVATNSEGTTQGPIEQFTTLLGAPYAYTEQVTPRIAPDATLVGHVDPEGSPTTVSFRYGTDYSFTTGTVTTPAQSIGAGDAFVTVSAALTGLAAGTYYYYRIVATNAGGTEVGNINSFVLSNATSLSSVSGRATYGGASTLTATLTANGAPVSGKTVAFSVSVGGSPVDEGTATTDANGVAMLSGVNLTGFDGGTARGIVQARFLGDLADDASDGDGDLTVNKASATLALSGLSAAYDGAPHRATAATTPAGLGGVTVIYVHNGQRVATPEAAGTYTVVALLDNPNYAAAPAVGTLVIAPPPPPPPTITSAQLYYQPVVTGHGKHAKTTAKFAGFALTFNEALDPAGAQNAGNFAVRQSVMRGAKVVSRPVGVSVQYNATTHTVDVILAGKPNFTRGGSLVLKAPGIANTFGAALGGRTVFAIARRGRGITG